MRRISAGENWSQSTFPTGEFYILHNQTAAVMLAYFRLRGDRRVFVVSVSWYPSS
jgi:hypothetical protein